MKWYVKIVDKILNTNKLIENPKISFDDKNEMRKTLKQDIKKIVDPLCENYSNNFIKYISYNRNLVINHQIHLFNVDRENTNVEYMKDAIDRFDLNYLLDGGSDEVCETCAYNNKSQKAICDCIYEKVESYQH